MFSLTQCLKIRFYTGSRPPLMILLCFEKIMSLISLLALAGAMFLLAITPGPGVFATVARALASGFKHSAAVVAGIVTGDISFLLFAIFGISAIAENLHELFMVIKYTGAAYLIFLGFKLWREKPKAIQISSIKDQSWNSSFFAGLFITLGNPKVILFYLGFLPTFVDLTSLSGMDVFAIASVVSLVLGTTKGAAPDGNSAALHCHRCACC